MTKRLKIILIGAILIAFTISCKPQTVIVKATPEPTPHGSSLPAIQTPYGPAYPYSNGVHTCYILEVRDETIMPLGCVK